MLICVVSSRGSRHAPEGDDAADLTSSVTCATDFGTRSAFAAQLRGTHVLHGMLQRASALTYAA